MTTTTVLVVSLILLPTLCSFFTHIYNRIYHFCPILWCYIIRSGSPMFAQCCDVTESDEDHPVAHYFDVTEFHQNIPYVCPVLWCYRIWRGLTCLSVNMMLQNLIRIPHVCLLLWCYRIWWGLTCLSVIVILQSDQDLPLFICSCIISV